MVGSKKATTRIETDSMGEIEVPADKYWGAQTERSFRNFKIGDDLMPWSVIRGLAIVKLCAAKANKKLNLLDHHKADVIIEVAEEVIAGKLAGNFPLIVWQTGSGTQSNMNVNEVISNRAIEKLGGTIGSKVPIHPNDDVNRGQSSNDAFPTAMNVATAWETNQKLLPALEALKTALQNKITEFKGIIKVGRTHLQDAVPLTLSQEFSGYLAQITNAETSIKQALEHVYNLAQGGTAVGTGLNVTKEFAPTFVEFVREYTQLPFKSADNKFAAIAAHDDLVNFSGSLNTLAVALNKIANDLRFLACGPRAGIGELYLPANEPGSSIMPGKVNPTQLESLTMVCYEVMGNHYSISLGGMSGQLELNAYKPLIIFKLLRSINLLSDAINSLIKHCLVGISANQAKIKEYLTNSLMLVTALNKKIGYDKAAMIAKYAFKNNTTLKNAALALGLVSEADFDKIVDPEKMV